MKLNPFCQPGAGCNVCRLFGLELSKRQFSTGWWPVASTVDSSGGKRGVRLQLATSWQVFFNKPLLFWLHYNLFRSRIEILIAKE